MGEKVLVTRSYLADIGDAIRERVGGSQTYRPSEMAPAIRTHLQAQDTALLEKELAGTYENSAVSYVGEYMLANNPWLTAVSFPACREIGSSAFLGCSALESVYAPSCQAIREAAFRNCRALSEASFPECRNLGGGAFAYCSKISFASFPACTAIWSTAFTNCQSLRSVYAPLCEQLGSGVFMQCSGLAAAEIGRCSVIGSYAFSGCARLSQLRLTGPSVASLYAVNAFWGTPMSQSSYLGYFGSIYVPASLYSEYVSAANWSYYSGRLASVEG